MKLPKLPWDVTGQLIAKERKISKLCKVTQRRRDPVRLLYDRSIKEILPRSPIDGGIFPVS